MGYTSGGRREAAARGVPLTIDELERWADSCAAFHARFAPLFGRRETREQAGKYLRGLLAPVERKNGWQLAEALGDGTPDRTQRLLYRADWDADAARDELQRFVAESFGDPEAIGVVDETGFLKKGTAAAYVSTVASWLFSTLPAVPLYCRCTPTAAVPFFRRQPGSVRTQCSTAQLAANRGESGGRHCRSRRCAGATARSTPRITAKVGRIESVTPAWTEF